MVAFRSDTAYIEVRGKNFAIPLDKLSIEDQKWVAEWAKKNTDYRLDFSVRGLENTQLRRSDSQRDAKERKESWEWETWGYQLAVVNRSGIDLSGLTVNYQMVIRKTHATDPTHGKKEKSETPKVVSGTMSIARLANTDRVVLDLPKVELAGHAWQTMGYVYKIEEGTGRRLAFPYWDNFSDEEELDGLWVKVYQDDVLVADWKSDGKLIKETPWQGPDAPVAKLVQAGAAGGDALDMLSAKVDEASKRLAAALRNQAPPAQIAAAKKEYDDARKALDDALASK